MFIQCYTRETIEKLYDVRLAKSVHFAISRDGKEYIALNHNSGVLYGKATENGDGSLNAKCLDNPVIVAVGNTYKVICIRKDENGNDDESSKGMAIEFTTKDFLDFTEGKLVNVSEHEKAVSEAQKCSVVCAEGMIPGNVVEISEAVYDRLLKKLGERVSVSVKVEENVKVSSKEDLENLKCTVVYSDGTEDVKRVDWDTEAVDFSKPGKYEIKGKIRQQHFEFPIAINRADPCVGKWQGKYYFIATNDADGNHTLYIRESDTLEELKTAEEVLLLDSSTYEDVGNLLWAPEFHEINGKLYIFHACTPDPFFNEESHIMALKEGGNPMKREDWSRPMRVVRADGSELCEAGKTITLDMTCFEWQGSYYAIWSQRQFIPKDLGAWLYIAKINPDEPWKLASEPVVLSKPELGWANNHTFVDEGPFALIRGDKLFVTFSAAAVDASYVVGLLQIDKGKDLLVRENWKKTGYPILTARSVTGEYGTGHNAYVYDEDGTIWNTYHARPGAEAPRCSGFRRVHFDIDGEPVLDLVEEKDVADDIKDVVTIIDVCGAPTIAEP